MNYLLDTNVISELRKQAPDAHVSSWFLTVRASDMYLSVLVLGEISRGVHLLQRRDHQQARIYEEWMVRVKGDFSSRLLPVTAEITEAWGRLGVPNPVPVVDGLMAATALVHRLTLVTRNTVDFSNTGVSVLNPWLV